MQIRQKFVTILNYVAGHPVERMAFIEQAGKRLTVAVAGFAPLNFDLDTEAEAAAAYDALVASDTSD